MSVYAIINDDGLVTNIVLWDGNGNIFEGITVVNIDGTNAGIGWTYKDGKFTPPENADD